MAKLLGSPISDQASPSYEIDAKMRFAFLFFSFVLFLCFVVVFVSL